MAEERNPAPGDQGQPDQDTGTPKVQVQGQAIPWSEEEIAVLAEVSPYDVAIAKARAMQWRDLYTLLNAPPIDDVSEFEE